MTARAKFIEPDFRRQAKGPHCCVCGQRLAPGRPRRYVRLLDSAFVVHPSDTWVRGEPVRLEHDGQEYSDFEDNGTAEIGLDCAKRLGLEWSMPQPPTTT